MAHAVRTGCARGAPVLDRAVSEVTTCREAPGRFLCTATAELLEQFGFTRRRQVGKHA